jgi:uroporphyrinogen decarboxylase
MNAGGAAAGLTGLKVVAFESRMAAEVAALIERRGGRAIVAPAMREVPLEDNQAAFDFAARLLVGDFDVVVFLTGVGTRALFTVIETRYPRETIVEAVHRAIVVARGPKPLHVLRELGLQPQVVAPEPNTWRELLAMLSAATSLHGKRVAIQEYGVSNRELIAGLEARGAEVVIVPVYRWALPLDRGPLLDALRKISAGEADVAIFTSSHQVTNVISVADAEGIRDAVRRGLAAMAVGSVGPVCSEQLRAHGINVDFEPEHPKLGHLVKEAASRAADILASKRAHASRIELGELRAPRRAATVGASSHRDHPILKACRREATSFTPIWLMRQAGRYMPEYRRVRDQHDFIEMCRRPDIAAEVTVTAVERLSVDAAIVFADILLPLIPMGVGLHYEKGDGPIVDHPIRTAADLERAHDVDVAELGYVGESIKLVKSAIGARTPIIGFAGAPFTLASYLIEGGASRQYQATKTLMYTQPDIWHRLMEMLARVTADYLNMQIAAGADLVQLFDSWVGSLGPDDYRRFVLPHMASVIAAIPADVPVIHFGTVTGNLLELMREAGGDVIGLDWRVDLAEAWARLDHAVAVQGNLDPIALFADVAEIRERARAILARAAGRPGHIFNLGHGILPETPVDHVIALVDAVHELSRR